MTGVFFVGDGVGWFTEGVVGSGAGVVVGRAAGRVAGWVAWFWQRLDDCVLSNEGFAGIEGIEDTGGIAEDTEGIVEGTEGIVEDIGGVVGVEGRGFSFKVASFLATFRRTFKWLLPMLAFEYKLFFISFASIRTPQSL